LLVPVLAAALCIDFIAKLTDEEVAKIVSIMQFSVSQILLAGIRVVPAFYDIAWRSYIQNHSFFIELFKLTKDC